MVRVRRLNILIKIIAIIFELLLIQIQVCYLLVSIFVYCVVNHNNWIMHRILMVMFTFVFVVDNWIKNIMN